MLEPTGGGECGSGRCTAVGRRGAGAGRCSVNLHVIFSKAAGTVGGHPWGQRGSCLVAQRRACACVCCVCWGSYCGVWLW